MKILYLLSQRPDSTGSGFYVRALIKEALKKGHSCYLVAGVSQEDSIEILPSDNYSFIRFEGADLPCPIPGMSDVMPYKSTRFIDMTEKEINDYKKCFKRVIQNAVNTFKPDIIHSNHLWIMSSVAREVCPDLPMITSCHGTDLRQIKNCEHLKHDVVKSCKKIDRIIALSQSQKNDIAALLDISKEKINVAGSGFNDKLFLPAKKPKPPPVKLLYAGKLSSAKGVPLLLKAINRLKNSNIPFHLSLAGSGTGEDYEICRSFADDLKGYVTFLGSIKQDDLAKRMRESHIFILPSFFEGLPLVLFEALASGCKIITTSLQGSLEILGDKSLDFIRFLDLPELENIDSPFESDIPQLIQKLSEILKEEIEKSLLNPDIEMEKAEILIRDYRWEEVFKRIEKTYMTFSKIIS